MHVKKHVASKPPDNWTSPSEWWPSHEQDPLCEQGGDALLGAAIVIACTPIAVLIASIVLAFSIACVVAFSLVAVITLVVFVVQSVLSRQGR